MRWRDGATRRLIGCDDGTAAQALEASEAARGWMGESFHGAYLMHKRGEAALMAGLTEAEQCARYADTY